MDDLNSQVERAYEQMQSPQPAPPVDYQPQAVNDLDELAAAQRQHARTVPYVGVDLGFPPCPICGYRGQAVKKSKGSVIVAFVLLMFGILPGLLYLMLFSGYVYKCRQCGAKRAEV